MPFKGNRSFTLLLFHTPIVVYLFVRSQIVGTNGKIPKIGRDFSKILVKNRQRDVIFCYRKISILNIFNRDVKKL